jgi:hypothetical protein
MTDQMGEWRKHQTADSSQKHQPLVNIAPLPVPIAGRYKYCECHEIAKRIDQSG